MAKWQGGAEGNKESKVQVQPLFNFKDFDVQSLKTKDLSNYGKGLRVEGHVLLTLSMVLEELCMKATLEAIIRNDSKHFADITQWDFSFTKTANELITCLKTIDGNHYLECVSTVKYSFLINGQVRGYLTPTWGLRQSDPLSPYLFLLGAEVFSALLNQKASQGLLKGISICDSAPVIHHLLFADDSLLFGVANHAECGHIKAVLADYEKASGQLVNFGKSNIVFSKGTPVSLQSSIAGELGVGVVVKHEKYLGLPTYVGKSKTETFAFIKERLSKKLEGWQGKLLSGAGKGILIRVVAQALPSYSMSCFLLPKSFYAALHQKCARFWLGSKQEDRKIHWLSWEKLCRPKERGGMGFRDLYAHNIAMLAKQGWRILQFPDSLVARLFRARYFPSSSFWSATATDGSACWKGIAEARSVLARGMRWQVGDGTRVCIWEDPWLPRPFSFKPLYRVNTHIVLVSELISDFVWNRNLVNILFDASDAELILSIPISSRGRADRLVWHHDAKGAFTTKSAYWQAAQWLHSSASTSSQVEQIWHHIWRSNVPRKVKINAWKACGSILPTVSQLRTKHVYIDALCYLCNSAVEIVEHVVRDCPYVREVLCCSALEECFEVEPNISCLDWLELCHSQIPKELFEKLLWGIWSVWKERNCRLWKNTQQHVGQIKANVDAAFDSVLHCGGLDVAFRDSMGCLVGGCCVRVDFVHNAVMVEALVARLACQVALQLQFSPVVFESDCLKVVKDAQSGVSDLSGYGTLIADIQSLLISCPGSRFVHVYREANVLAHKLAKKALCSSLDVRWYGSLPAIISNFVTALV
ncbi:PREDICTED: putative ribonuclease H protein At1g65750-like [Fragaria vesca subsp. vesca]